MKNDSHPIPIGRLRCGCNHPYIKSSVSFLLCTSLHSIIQSSLTKVNKTKALTHSKIAVIRLENKGKIYEIRTIFLCSLTDGTHKIHDRVYMRVFYAQCTRFCRKTCKNPSIAAGNPTVRLLFLIIFRSMLRRFPDRFSVPRQRGKRRKLRCPFLHGHLRMSFGNRMGKVDDIFILVSHFDPVLLVVFPALSLVSSDTPVAVPHRGPFLQAGAL